MLLFSCLLLTMAAPWAQQPGKQLPAGLDGQARSSPALRVLALWSLEGLAAAMSLRMKRSGGRHRLRFVTIGTLSRRSLRLLRALIDRCRNRGTPGPKLDSHDQVQTNARRGPAFALQAEDDW